MRHPAVSDPTLLIAILETRDGAGVEDNEPGARDDHAPSRHVA